RIADLSGVGRPPRYVSTFFTSPVDPLGGRTAVVDRDGERPDQQAEDAVVDGARDEPANRIGNGDVGSGGRDEHEQQHRIEEAQERDCHDRQQGPQPTEGLHEDASGADRDEERERRGPEGPAGESIEKESANERPDDAAVDAGCDGPDDPDDEDWVRLGISDGKVRNNGDFEERGEGRPDRGEEEAHGRRSALGEILRSRANPKASRRCDGWERRPKYPMPPPDRAITC